MTVRGFKGVVIGLAIGGAIGGSVGGIDPARAQTSFAPAVEPDQWQDFSPDRRKEMRRQYLENLPPTKREKLRSQVQRFNSMPPPKKQEICRRFQKDRGYLPPACQKLF